MNKTIRILSFISVAIMVLSCVALLACLLLQEPLCQIVFHASDEIIGKHPSLPIGQVVYAFGNLCAAVFLLLSVGKKSYSVTDNVLCAVATGAVLPFLRNFLYQAQTFLTAQFQNDTSLIAMSYVTNLCNTALSLVGTATALMLVVCGMNIAIKYTQRNTEGALH